jgi:hypothetical protein
MISKDKLFFDPTDADTIKDSDSVGAFVRDAAGNLITSTLNQLTKQSLDVNVTNGIAVDLDGIYNLSTNPTPDNVGIIAFSRAVTPGLAEQGFTPTGAALGAILAADISKVHALDVNAFNMALGSTGDMEQIKSHSNAMDVYLAGQAADIDVNLTNATIAVTQSTSPWVVSATNLDIRDLTHVSDSVRLGDGTSFFTSTSENSKLALDVHLTNSSITASVNDAALANTAIAAAAVSLSGTALALPSSALAARKYLFVQNLGSRAMYVGPSGVSASSGLRLAPNAVGEFRIGPSISLYGISDGTAQDTRVLEIA